jgi:cytoskeletal protein RodZ
MAANDKDTIYIDIDDEITGIIDKLQASGGKVVALVLPKRAAVFQSIVNMKLLKRAADGSDKNLVLITAEAGLLPLAGVAGIHVAKTLSSKPSIPLAPKLAEDVEEAINEEGEAAGVTAATAGDKPVGELAGKPPASDAVETLTLDDDTLPAESIGDKPKPKTFEPPAKAKGKGKNKKLRIPDFNKFRLLLVGGILLFILLIVFIYMAIKVLPKATITIDTGAQSIDTNLSLNLSTTAKTLDPSSGTIPAKLAQQQKTYTQQSATTGQKNNGNKASGSVNMTATEKGADLPSSVPAGTGLSSNGQTYITQSDTVFSADGHNNGHGSITYASTAPTTVIAQNPGASYNGATSFAVAGRGDVSASANGNISGGTDNIVRSVNQNDINGAKAKISTDDPAVKQSLQDQLKKSGYFVINATYNAGTPIVTTSANVGAVADNVTVTEAVTYTLFGVHKDDLKTLVDTSAESQIDTGKQKVQDEGLDHATFNVDNASATGAQVTMDTKAVAGPDIDINSIKNNAVGQKAGKIKGDLEGNPGIKSVDVNLSPFWVSTVPKKTSKIKVVISKPKTTASKTNANNP